MATIINLDNVTNSNKTGSFDKLIDVLGEHLKAEKSSGRITGQEYANTYVQLMTAALQQSFSFELNKAQAENQADLIKAQIAQTEAESLRINSAKALLDKQVINATSENAQIVAQTSLINAQKLVADQEVLNAVEAVKQTTAQTALISAQKDNLIIEKDKIVKETLQLIAQTNLTNKQVEIGEQERLKTIQETIATTKQVAMLDAQILGQTKQNLRTDEEIKYTTAKTNTERASYSDTLDGVSVTGILGKQRELLQAQTDGFKRNAEQGVLKSMVDVWSVLRTTDPDAVNPVDFGFTPQNSKDVVNRVRVGIGLPSV